MPYLSKWTIQENYNTSSFKYQWVSRFKSKLLKIVRHFDLDDNRRDRRWSRSFNSRNSRPATLSLLFFFFFFYFLRLPPTALYFYRPRSTVTVSFNFHSRTNGLAHRLYWRSTECALPFLFNTYSINRRGITSNDFTGRWIKQIMPTCTERK